LLEFKHSLLIKKVKKIILTEHISKKSDNLIK
jgi:hypothetical protein